MSQPAQISLFDLLGAASPIEAAAPAPAEAVHYVVVTTRRAMTACGTVVTASDWKQGQWISDAGVSIACSLDRYSGRTTCARCKEHMW